MKKNKAPKIDFQMCIQDLLNAKNVLNKVRTGDTWFPNRFLLEDMETRLSKMVIILRDRQEKLDE